MIYDIIIIGAGISGLYSAYLIKKYYPNKTFIILEKNKKKYIGGRIHTEKFNNIEVVTGAGIGRKNKDYLLIKLLNELNLEYKEFIVKKDYAKTVDKVNISSIIKKLKEKYNRELYGDLTFHEFSEKILGKELYKNFVKSCGYSDFEKADIYDTLYNYGFDDNLENWTGISVPWKRLINSLVEKIGIQNIKTSTNVNDINLDETIYKISINQEIVQYKCKKVIIATTLESLLHFFPKNPIYKEIGAQSFLRVYGKFSKSSAEIMKEIIKNTLIVGGLIYKIISINSEKGIYMICYNDNKAANILKKRIENNEENRLFWCNLIEKLLGINNKLKLNNIKGFYWSIGTHYYKPLNVKYKNRNEFIRIAQNPEKNMYVVGEVISIHQGWTEGALDSVQKIIKNI